MGSVLGSGRATTTPSGTFLRRGRTCGFSVNCLAQSDGSPEDDSRRDCDGWGTPQNRRCIAIDAATVTFSESTPGDILIRARSVLKASASGREPNPRRPRATPPTATSAARRPQHCRVPCGRERNNAETLHAEKAERFRPRFRRHEWQLQGGGHRRANRLAVERIAAAGAEHYGLRANAAALRNRPPMLSGLFSLREPARA